MINHSLLRRYAMLVLLTFFTGNCLAQADTSSRQLKEVSIKGRRPLIRQEIDRISYDVQRDAESKLLSAKQLMAKIPLLSLDAEGKIRLRGSASYRVLINGKESAMMVSNAEEVLSKMPASAISRIDVITTPSSKYDGEGPAGLINIVMLKAPASGYNAGIRTAWDFPAEGPSAGGNFTARIGKFSLALTGGMGSTKAPETAEQSYRESAAADQATLTNQSKKSSHTRSGFAGAELSFQADSLNLFTAEYSPYRGTNNVRNFRTFALTSVRDGLSAYELAGENEYSWSGQTAGLNYQRGFAGESRKLLTLSYRYVSNDNPQFNDVLISKAANITLPSFRQKSESNFTEQIIQSDFVSSWGHLLVESGVKLVLRRNVSDYSTAESSATDAGYIPNAAYTNHFTSTQDVYSAYNGYDYKLGSWMFRAGFRLEYTQMRAEFQTGNAAPSHQYLHLIPALSMLKELGASSRMTMGYTRRIVRPRIWQLDPFQDRTVPNMVTTGNPDLVPALSDHLEITYSHSAKASFTANLSYASASHPIQKLSLYNSQQQLTLTTYANSGKNNQLALYLNLNYPAFSGLNLSARASVSGVRLSAMADGQPLERNGINIKTGLTATKSIYRSWKLNGTLNYDGREITLTERMNELWYVSFAAYGDLVKDKLSLSLGLRNPFSKYRYFRTETSGANFRQSYSAENFYRSFNVSLSWKFGGLKEGVKKNKRTVKTEDGSS